MSRPLTLALALLLSALPASAAPLRLALPGLNGIQLDPKVAGFVSEQLALELGNRGVEVITAREISTLVGLERQNQLLKCADEDASCVAEIGDALGVDAVLMGDVAKIGSRYQLSVKALAAETGKRLAAFSDGVEREEELVALTGRGAAALASELSRATGRALAPSTVEAAPTLRSRAWIPAAVGGVLLAGGVAAELVAYGKYQTLKDNPPGSYQEASSLAQEGKGWQTAFAVAASAGAAALGAAAVMYFTGGEAAASAYVSPTAAGAAVAFRFE